MGPSFANSLPHLLLTVRTGPVLVLVSTAALRKRRRLWPGPVLWLPEFPLKPHLPPDAAGTDVSLTAASHNRGDGGTCFFSGET